MPKTYKVGHTTRLLTIEESQIRRPCKHRYFETSEEALKFLSTLTNHVPDNSPGLFFIDGPNIRRSTRDGVTWY